MLGPTARAALDGTRFLDVRWHDSVTSTNDLAAEAARAGAPEGLVVVADHQTAGRGRHDRRWEARPGSSLLTSVLLRPAWPPSQAHIATLAVALAAADACETTAGVVPRLKWPNDLVVGAGKLGGILAEQIGDAVVVGLGLNVDWPGPPPSGGVALNRLVQGRPGPDRASLLLAFLARLDHLLDRPPSSLVDAVRQRSATLGRLVRVDTGAGVLKGRATDLTVDGHLVLTLPSGSQRTLAAADVVNVRAAPLAAAVDP